MASRSVSRHYPSCLMPSLVEQVLLRLSAVSSCGLMVNHVSHLQSVGVSAAILFGNKRVDKKYQAVDSDVSESKYCLIYSSPEALVTNDQWTQLTLQPPFCNCLAAIAIDEAHCVYKCDRAYEKGP